MSYNRKIGARLFVTAVICLCGVLIVPVFVYTRSYDKAVVQFVASPTPATQATLDAEYRKRANQILLIKVGGFLTLFGIVNLGWSAIAAAARGKNRVSLQ